MKDYRLCERGKLKSDKFEASAEADPTRFLLHLLVGEGVWGIAAHAAGLVLHGPRAPGPGEIVLLLRLPAGAGREDGKSHGRDCFREA